MNLKTIIDYCVNNKGAVIALLLFVYPFGIYCMWKGNHFSDTTRKVISVFLALWTVYLLNDDSETNTGFVNPSDCAAVFESNGCTYYRDGNCNVITRSCN